MTFQLALISVVQATTRAQLVKRVARQTHAQLAQLLLTVLSGGWGFRLTKMKAFPALADNRAQAELIFFQAKKIVFVRHKAQPAVKPIRPTVELTGQRLAAAALVPDDLVAAMRAHIVKGPHAAVPAPHNKDRGMTHRQVFDKIIPGLWDLLKPSDVQPELLEDFFALLRKVGG